MASLKKPKSLPPPPPPNVQTVAQLVASMPSELRRPRWESMLNVAPFHIAKIRPASSIDRVTRRWIRNANDERAAQEGYRFDEERGIFVVDWISSYCCLYEGDKAGLPMDIEDWQYEWFMQVHGWVHFDNDIGRWIRRFRRANAWIPKKNAKSPTLAAEGLYLLAGDGEFGQKCYTLARDKEQGKISHNHAKMMVRYSEQLNAECKISETTHMITHLPTMSEYRLVAGDNEKSTEGFNGSLLTDEVHVVNRKLMKRVSRAGISRSEPLHVEMSTAGDNSDEYGGQRFEHTHRIFTGEFYDPEHYVMEFAIPQDTSLERLSDQAFIEKAGRECNPSMGRILRFSEYMSDWRASQETQTQQLEHAMYRLNKWMAAGANWIPYADWLQCGKKYTLDRLKDYPCFGGLDLSKTRDMSSFVLVFAVPHKKLGIRPYLIPFFWLPQTTMLQMKRKVDLTLPKFQGCIEFCPGKTIDYSMISEKINWCYENLDLRNIAYDKAHSSTLMKSLVNDYELPEEEFMVQFPQTMAFMGPATGDFERFVLTRGIAHDNNAVLNWQISHTKVISDKNGSKKPIKPEEGDYRKIDGVVASIMACAAMLEDDDVMAAYEEAGSLLLYDKNDKRAKRPKESKT